MEKPLDTDTVKVFGSIRESDVLKGKPVDGIWFRRATTPEDPRYLVDFVSFPPGTVVCKDDSPEGTGFNKWLVVLFEEADDEPGMMDVHYYQMVCGDIMYWVNNQMKGIHGGQGMVMKTSKPGFKAIYNLMKNGPSETIKRQIEENFDQWCTICDTGYSEAQGSLERTSSNTSSVPQSSTKSL